MSIKDRLKTAYENVAFDADNTWIHTSVQFQRANKELFSKECQFRLIKAVELRPRTVKDCIPKSKLAQYSNYEYSEARELSYAPSSSNFNAFMYYSREPENRSCKEPWLLPEVDDLFIWFTNHHHFARQISVEEADSKSTSNAEYVYYESPILNADTFDTRLLKMQIVSDKIRNIWKVNNTLCESVGFVKERSLNVYKTPGNIFYLKYDVELSSEESPARLKTKDFDLLKLLSKSLKEQNCWILRCTAVKSHQVLRDVKSNVGQIKNNNNNNKSDVAPSKRLYSAVLQGLSANKKTVSANEESTVLVHGGAAELNADRLATTPATCEQPSLPTTPEYEAPGLSHFTPSVSTSTYPDSNKAQSTSYEQQANTKANNRAKSLNTLPSGPSVHSNASNYAEKTNMYAPPTLAYNSFQNAVPMTSPQYLSTFNYQLNAHYSNSYQNSCIYSNTLTTNMSQIVVSRGVQPLSNQTYFPTTPVFMMQQNRMSTLYPMSHQYVPQSYYSPAAAAPGPLQRWLHHSDYVGGRSAMPPQTFPVSMSQGSMPLPPVHWLNQNSHVLHTQGGDLGRVRNTEKNYTANRGRRVAANLAAPAAQDTNSVKYKILQDGKAGSGGSCEPSATKATGRGALNSPNTSSVQETARFAPGVASKTTYDCGGLRSLEEDVVTGKPSRLTEADVVDRYVPVTATMSEELEIEALEQYCNSNDNVYQELERQAEEEYEEPSENWGSPPNSLMRFGGFELQWNYA